MYSCRCRRVSSRSAFLPLVLLHWLPGPLSWLLAIGALDAFVIIVVHCPHCRHLACCPLLLFDSFCTHPDFDFDTWPLALGHWPIPLMKTSYASVAACLMCVAPGPSATTWVTHVHLSLSTGFQSIRIPALGALALAPWSAFLAACDWGPRCLCHHCRALSSLSPPRLLSIIIVRIALCPPRP